MKNAAIFLAFAAMATTASADELGQVQMLPPSPPMAKVDDYLHDNPHTPLPTDAGPLQYYPSTAPTPAPRSDSYAPTHVYGGQTCSNGSCNGWDSTGGHWMTTESSGTTTGFYNRY